MANRSQQLSKQQLSIEISLNEVKIAIKSLKKGKSLCCDVVPNEMLIFSTSANLNTCLAWLYQTYLCTLQGYDPLSNIFSNSEDNSLRYEAVRWWRCADTCRYLITKNLQKTQNNIRTNTFTHSKAEKLYRQYKYPQILFSNKKHSLLLRFQHNR